MLKHIVLDFGNSRVKWGIFQGDQLTNKGITNQESDIYQLISGFEKGIVSSVRSGIDLEVPASFLELSHQTPLPIDLHYNTPQTLGLDRIAAAVGVANEFSGQTSLVIDAGTCVTYDLLTDLGQFKGGAIAPGLQMRLKSMHTMTEKLPDLEIIPEEASEFPGMTTEESMKAGAVFGILHEINGYISLLKEEYGNLNVILTGGDASFFESKIKAPIFVRPEIILSGLNRILLHNETNA